MQTIGGTGYISDLVEMLKVNNYLPISLEILLTACCCSCCSLSIFAFHAVLMARSQ
jgi:hypothetical protein